MPSTPTRREGAGTQPGKRSTTRSASSRAGVRMAIFRVARGRPEAVKMFQDARSARARRGTIPGFSVRVRADRRWPGVAGVGDRLSEGGCRNKQGGRCRHAGVKEAARIDGRCTRIAAPREAAGCDSRRRLDTRSADCCSSKGHVRTRAIAVKDRQSRSSTGDAQDNFTITIMRKDRTPRRNYCRGSYTRRLMESRTGELHVRKTIQNSWTSVGSVDLPPASR